MICEKIRTDETECRKIERKDGNAIMFCGDLGKNIKIAKLA